MKLSERIKSLREEKNLSQSALAKLLDVYPSTINQLEAEKTQTMNADLALKMARVFEVTVEFLLTGEYQNTQKINLREDNVDYRDKYIKVLEEKAKLSEENTSLVRQLLEKEIQEKKQAQEKSENL